MEPLQGYTRVTCLHYKDTTLVWGTDTGVVGVKDTAILADSKLVSVLQAPHVLE